MVVTNSAKRSMSATLTPQISLARSRVHSLAANKNCSAPVTCCATNLLSARLCSLIQRATAYPNTTSVPGRSAICKSARSAALMRRGSITTTTAPFFFAWVMIGCKCVLLAPGFAPHTTINFECTKSIGSLDNMSPNTRSHAAALVPAQMVCSISGHPNRSNRCGINRFLSIRADDELYRYGSTLSGPYSLIAPEILLATWVIASSHVALRNCPDPFAPVRINGVIMRSFEYTRSA